MRPAGGREMSGHATWRALGTTVRLVLEGGDMARGRKSVSDLLDQVDRTYSRFRSDSELSLLNGRTGQRVPISPLLTWALAAALRGARLTHGLVDPTLGLTTNDIPTQKTWHRRLAIVLSLDFQ